MKLSEGKEKEYKDWYDKNKKDSYSHRCFTYAEEWAEMMEDEIEKSSKSPYEVIKEFGNKFAYKADYDGITGFMYSVARSILSQEWIYKDEFKRCVTEKWID